MVKITIVESSRSVVSLRVEGRIIGSSVEELRRACDVHTSLSEVQLSLNLADVSFADAAGIVLLKELRSRIGPDVDSQRCTLMLGRKWPFLSELRPYRWKGVSMLYQADSKRLFPAGYFGSMRRSP